MDGVAYRSKDKRVLEAWDTYLEHVKETHARRAAFSERYGRQLMARRTSFGHGSSVVGLEILPDDEPGQLLGEHGEFRVPKTHRPRTATPNSRRKAGKDVEQELKTLTIEGPSLPGMPEWTLVGFRSLAPALHRHANTVWAYWSDPIEDHHSGGEVDLDIWTPVKLSAYHLAREKYEEAKQAVEA